MLKIDDMKFIATCVNALRRAILFAGYFAAQDHVTEDSLKAAIRKNELVVGPRK